MRICLTHMRHAYVGGTERYLNELSSYLCEHGHEVTIVCRSHKEPPHPEVQFHKLRGFALGPAWRRWVFAKQVERYVSANQGNFDIVLGLGKTWSHDVVRIGGGVMLAHVEHMSAEFMGAARSRTTRLRPTDRVALAIERRTFAPGAYRRIFTNSNMVRNDVITRYGVEPGQIEVIHNGVDSKHFNPGYKSGAGAALRQSIGFLPEHLVFLFLGSGFPRKGFDLLLEAFPHVLRRYPLARLLVVGRDSEQSAYMERAADLGIAHAVYFAGLRTDPEVCYGAADVYVLPTRYDSFGFSVLEALASGLPVITTDTCGASELLQQGVHGSVISVTGAQQKAVSALAEALVDWCERGRIERTQPVVRHLAVANDIQSKLRDAENLLKAVAAEKKAQQGH